MPVNLEHYFGPIWQWLLKPLSGAAIHEIDMLIAWHARLMVLAWAVMLPMGVIAARYYKVTPRQDWPRQMDNRAWWHAHRALQYGGVLTMLIGIALSWQATHHDSTPAMLHRYLGWAVLALGLVQIIGAWLRGSKGGPTEPQMRGDHYDMTAYRLRFEWIHKTCGWAALGIAVLTVVLGLIAADAPRWMPIVLAAWWLALITLAIRLERAGRNIDTYQAIWGPSPEHPGNQRPHVNWGMVRPALKSTLGQEK